MVENEGKNLEAVTEAEAREKHYLLTPQGLLSLLSYIQYCHMLRGGTIHGGLCPSTSIINQKNAPTDLAVGQSNRDNSSSEVPSSQVTLACIQLTKTDQHIVSMRGLSRLD